jgi:hypothetical protein
MIILREHVHIGPHVVHHNCEPLKQGIDGLTREISEVLLHSLVSRIHLSLNLGVSNMSFLQHRPDSTSQALCVHPIEFRLTQSMKQVVDRLVVGVEHVPRSWRKEVHRLDIVYIHRDIPKDLTFSWWSCAHVEHWSDHQSLSFKWLAGCM